VEGILFGCNFCRRVEWGTDISGCGEGNKIVMSKVVVSVLRTGKDILKGIVASLIVVGLAMRRSAVHESRHHLHSHQEVLMV
jgi:hypothetical protein